MKKKVLIVVSDYYKDISDPLLKSTIKYLNKKISLKIINMNKKDSMQEKDSPMEDQNDDFTDKSSTDNEYSKWVDNQGDEVKNVFGFNSSAELVNGRAAMIGFLMLILTELVFSGRPVTSSIFGIN